ncbi:pentatricopeptide repeat domain-containing protein [Colletotrichum falcatum]|nr:pentatricopeptide repeat domain-containing protein [Colletotrichum falcatum]
MRPDPFLELVKSRPDYFLKRSIKRIEAQAATTSKNISQWARELAHERKARYQEYGYLRYHLDKSELKHFANWKNDLVRLFEHVALGSSSRAPRKLLDWIMDRQDIEHTIENWASWPIHKRTESESWLALMFSAMWSCPDRALHLLEITTKDFVPPGYALKDAIHFLAKWQSQELAGEELASHAEALCKFVITIINKAPRHHVRLRQNTIYHLTNTTSIENVEALYRCLRENDHCLHSYTLLIMTNRLAKTSQKELALEMAIEAVAAGGADLNSSQWLSLCTSIIAIDPEHIKASDEFSAADAFSLLIEHDFVPNMVNYTALIRSLCLTGQLGKALEVFQVMQTHGIEPDTIIWSTLLDGAKRALSASKIEMVVASAAEHNAIDAVFLNDLLFSVLHFSEAETDEEKKKVGHGSVPAFAPMLHFYTKIFHLAPLQSLIPTDLTRYLDASRGLEMSPNWQLARQLFPALNTAMSAVPHKLSPTGATLGIMFMAYVKSLSRPINLISLYAYFRQLIFKGNPVATTFVREKGTFAYDVVIKALCESPGMLRAALDIIGDMLKHTLEERSKSSISALEEPAGEAAAPAPSSPSLPLHPPPSVFTWSILLHGFMSHREKGSGERILAMMRQHGIKPNLVTWNTLVAGYAKSQDVNKTVQSLEQLEAAGYEADDYTLRAFAKLVNREAALRKMEEAIERKKKNAEIRAKLMLDRDMKLQASETSTVAM